MALEYLTFEHKGEKSGAFVSVFNSRGMSLEFQDDFFRDGSLSVWSKEEADRDTKIQGYAQDDTVVRLMDKNFYHSSFQYKNGELTTADTITDKLETINPKRAFAFWTSLSAALRANPETPEKFRKNLEEIARITSLDDYIANLTEKREQTPEEIFNHDYLRRIYPDRAEDYLNPKYF